MTSPNHPGYLAHVRSSAEALRLTETHDGIFQAGDTRQILASALGLLALSEGGVLLIVPGKGATVTTAERRMLFFSRV